MKQKKNPVLVYLVIFMIRALHNSLFDYSIKTAYLTPSTVTLSLS